MKNKILSLLVLLLTAASGAWADVTYNVTEVIPVTVSGATKQWTFDMPASDVVLTPIYAAATIYESDGETEKQAYETLQEAFDNVQDGDIIVLEDTVTLTEMIQTPTITGGVKFILDFNGYPIYCNYYFKLNNAGDELTFKDTSDDQKGGMNDGAFSAVAGAKFIFDGGRYKCGNNTAQQMKNLCDINAGIELAEGKEFVDIEGAPDDDGFMVRVVYKASDLTIDPGKFATFYLDHNVKLADGTSTDVKLYTIIGVNEDRTTAYLTELTGVVEAGTPMLVYNSGNAKQAVTIEPTNEQPDAGNQGISPIEQFMGTSTAKTFSDDDMEAADYYALSGGKAFAKVRGGGTLKARQCWLQFTKAQGGTGGAGARTINLVFDSQTTGITTTDYTDSTDDAIYDLSGRKLNKQPKLKGVYIQRGNKTVIR